MSPYTLFSLFVVAAASSSVLAQSAASSAFVPLASKSFSYTNLPYQADTSNGVRGPQYGYNLCNSTTQNQQSLCQTSVINSISDFCLWGSPNPNETIGNTEGIEVAYCNKAVYGTRVFPPGTFTGLQWTRTPHYVQLVGFLDQTKVNLNAADYGGELDPHGADLRGNPLGGLVYSTAWSNGSTSLSAFQQVPQWNNFIGGGFFCFKLCDPNLPSSYPYCNNIYDLIGCSYNAPNAAVNGTFEACDGDDQDPVGIYTSNGVVMTYTQPPVGPITSMPYQPRVPASSNCQTFSSGALFTANTQAPASTSAPSSGSGSVPRSTPSGSGQGSSPTGTTTSGASGVVASSITTILGVAFAITFFA